MSDTNPRAIPGDNAPPLLTLEDLQRDHSDLEEAATGVLFKARNLPETVDSDETVEQYADVAKEIIALGKRVEARRVDVKAPYLAAERLGDGFFKGIATKLDKTLTIFDKRTKPYQDAKAAAARRAAEEEARQARERQEAAARAAAEAARRDREEREARERAQREEQERQWAIAAGVAPIDPTAEPAPAPAPGPAIDHRAQAAEHIDAAAAANREANSLEKFAAAKPAEHTRVRSSSGAMATTAQFWTFAVTDRDALGSQEAMARLWPFISDDAKDKAIAAFVKAGNRTLPGVNIYEETKPVWR